MNQNQLQKKQWRYDTAIEALQELIAHGDEEKKTFEKIIKDLETKRFEANTEYKKQLMLNDIHVQGVEFITSSNH